MGKYYSPNPADCKRAGESLIHVGKISGTRLYS